MRTLFLMRPRSRGVAGIATTGSAQEAGVPPNGAVHKVLMPTSSERLRLVDAVNGQPGNVLLVLAECMAGLAIVVMLVAMVVSDERVMSDPIDQGAASGTTGRVK